MKICLVALYDVHSIGIRTLHAILQKHHDVVSVFFKNHYANEAIRPGELETLIDTINSQNADIVGFGIRSHFFPILKDIIPHINGKILIGGHHATLCPEECAEYADAVCVGEAENSILGICHNMMNGAGKKIYGPARLVQNLDAVPMPVYNENQIYLFADPWDDIRISVISTRGCFFSCTFCYNHVYKKICDGYGKYIRRRSVDNVIEQVEMLKNKFNSLSSITMSDSVFTYDTEWISEFCEKWPETGLSFRAYGHFKMIDEAMLKMLVGAGCEMLTYGYQHGGERYRKDVFGRPETNKEIIEGSRILAGLGIPIRYDRIVDCPYETEQDREDDANLFNQLSRPFMYRAFPLMNHPKGSLTTQLLNDGIITEDQVEGNCMTAYKDAGEYTYYDIDNVRPVTWNGKEYAA